MSEHCKVLLDACIRCGKMYEPIFKGWTVIPVISGQTVCVECSKAPDSPEEPIVQQ